MLEIPVAAKLELGRRAGTGLRFRVVHGRAPFTNSSSYIHTYFAVMAVETQVVPSDEELSKIVISLREAHPALGVVKLLAQLKVEHPTLSVSEKRLRKTLAPSTTTTSTEKVSSDATADLVADTGLDASLDVSELKIKVKMFKGGKGKGLVAREKILQGEVIWSENPWISTTSPYVRLRSGIIVC